MHAGDVEIGEVGAVGFVDVVVAFRQLRAGGEEDGGEEVGRVELWIGSLTEAEREGEVGDVGEEAGEDAELLGCQ